MMTVLEEVQASNAGLRQRVKKLEEALEIAASRERAQSNLLAIIRDSARNSLQLVAELRRALPKAVATFEQSLETPIGAARIEGCPCPFCGHEVSQDAKEPSERREGPRGHADDGGSAPS